MVKAFVYDVTSRNTSIGFNGWIKDINGVNGSPRSIAPGFPDLDDQMNQMGITHFRFHDNLGFGDLDNCISKTDRRSQFLPNIPADKSVAALSLIADLGNTRTIFPNAAIGMRTHNASLALSNPNYTMTDKHFKKVMDNDPALNPTNIQREIMFRVGRNNCGGAEMPEDFDIYAKMTGELAKRYSLNYRQTGLPRKIKYWEIWNSTDSTLFWNNNKPNNYYEFYAKVARAIKQVDPSAKVGGAGVATGYNPGGAYLDGLLNYCRTNNVPIDFLSWHYYGNSTADPQNIIDIGTQIQRSLNQYGYGHIESLCTEWNSNPYADANNFSKLQSAKNAAYIASTLMYMNHTRVEKAYYYRGDACSFGLFNNEPGFCTYSAQAFHLYNQMFETPALLQGGGDFTSGLTTLAGISNSGTRINVLAANYQVGYDFSTGSPSNQLKLYKQHYLDGNRQLSKLTDQWSLDEWFGGVNPTTIHPNNEVTQRSAVSALPNYGNLNQRRRDYTQSNQGLQVSIRSVGSRTYKIRAWRIQEGGPLWSMTPEEVSASITHSLNNGILTITDTGAKRSTVTLYTIDFDQAIATPSPKSRNTTPNPSPKPNSMLIPTPNPNPDNSLVPTGYQPVQDGSGCIVLTKEHTYSINDFLPDKVLDKTKDYMLLFQLPPGSQILSCPEGTVFDGQNKSCQTINPNQYYDYDYNPATGQLMILTTKVNVNSGEGRYYVHVPDQVTPQTLAWQLSIQ